MKTSIVPYDVFTQKPTVYACYVNGGSGCSLTVDIANLDFLWKAPGETSMSALPTWIKKLGNDIWLFEEESIADPDDLKNAIGTSYIYYTVDQLPNMSKVYTDSTFSTLVPTEGLKYLTILLRCAYNNLAFSPSAENK